MTGGPDLRAASPTDAGAVGAILSEFVDTTPWMPRLHTRAEDLSHAGMLVDRGWTTVAVIGGRVLGFLAREEAYVHALYVSAAARGRGVGSALLQGAQAVRPTLDLWTFKANAGARRFYRRHGFAEVRSTAGDNDEGLPDIHLSWRSERAPLHV